MEVFVAQWAGEECLSFGSSLTRRTVAATSGVLMQWDNVRFLEGTGRSKVLLFLLLFQNINL